MVGEQPTTVLVMISWMEGREDGMGCTQDI